MHPDWDDDSPELRVNLARVHDSVEVDAYRRALPTIEAARTWQRRIMRNLAVPDPGYIGAFRGEPGLEECQVTVGGRWGVAADQVAPALSAFERRLQQAVAYLDALIPAGAPLSADQGRAIIELCAWTHAEWVRIHPFANGNGRTARIWANSIAMRYGLPPFLRLRPRPAGAYGAACAQAMLGSWTPTADCFHQLLEGFRQEVDSKPSPP